MHSSEPCDLLTIKEFAVSIWSRKAILILDVHGDSSLGGWASAWSVIDLSVYITRLGEGKILTKSWKVREMNFWKVIPVIFAIMKKWCPQPKLSWATWVFSIQGLYAGVNCNAPKVRRIYGYFESGVNSDASVSVHFSALLVLALIDFMDRYIFQAM